ncbi:MAG TPA: glucokinase [Thermoanaerobaculia bacterium]
MTLLAADVGGTKTLLRCVENDGCPIVEARYDSNAYDTFDELVSEFTARLAAPPDAACFAVAGPVHDGEADVTNVGWHLTERALERAHSIRSVMLVNDFHAIAFAVPFIDATDRLRLNEAAAEAGAPIAVLGAGTGLGQAFVVFHDGVPHVLSSEGGHGDFAPQDEEQTRLFLQLHERFGHVSWERLLSGSGLSDIFAFLGGEPIDAAEVAELADRGDARAVRAFEVFVDIYGAEAGNMALRLLARGGVCIAGGIAAKNATRFTDGRFRRAFIRKGRFEQLVASIPVDLILNEEAGLIGAVELARRRLAR